MIKIPWLRNNMETTWKHRFPLGKLDNFKWFPPIGKLPSLQFPDSLAWKLVETWGFPYGNQGVTTWKPQFSTVKRAENHMETEVSARPQESKSLFLINQNLEGEYISVQSKLSSSFIDNQALTKTSSKKNKFLKNGT